MVAMVKLVRPEIFYTTAFRFPCAAGLEDAECPLKSPLGALSSYFIVFLITNHFSVYQP